MPLHKTSRSYWGRGFVFVTLLYLLMWEWLRPLSDTTDTIRSDVFVIALGFMLFINYLALHRAANAVIKVGFIAFLLHNLYFSNESPLFSSEWIKGIWLDLKMNVSLIMHGQWDFTTQISRTLLFIVLIWVVSTVAYRFIMEKQRVLVLLLLTEVYLMTLETFTPFQAKWAIVRTLIIGLLLLAFMNLSVVEKVTKVSSRRATWPVSWIAATMALILLVSGIGFLAPKSEAAWPDPVTWVTNVGKGKIIQRIGYGEDDSYLGGPFMLDDQLIFNAKTPQVQYWRGETKNFYDGHGWSSTLDLEREYPVNQTLPAELYDTALEKTHGSQSLMFDKAMYPVLFHSGEINKVNGSQPSLDRVLYRGNNSKLQAADDKNLKAYEVEVNFPVFYRDDLMASKQEYPESIVNDYTQLPAKFPKRITALAMQVTEGKNTPWEKAQAIESFLRYGQFSYETTDVAVPKKNEDYVEQFLFVSKKGYCDNFSSSMVTMLRSIGIPARWVKGFNSGDYEYDAATGQYHVEIRSLNAHSWPEVYFAGIGWVPFEPTPGFTSPLTLKNRETEDANISIPASVSDRRFERDGLELEDELGANTTGGGGIHKPLLSTWAIVSIVGALLAAAAVLLYIFRFSIWLSLLERAKKKGKEETVLFTLFDRILQMMERKGGERLPSQTMREYVISMERFKPSQSGRMREFTKLFEGVRYGRLNKEDIDGVWDKARIIWKDVATRFRS